MAIVAGDIEFEWDDENTNHLAVHKVKPAEFEQVMTNDPLDLDYEVVNGEDRYRSVGFTNKGRLLSVAWTIRSGRVRAVTAFTAGISDKRTFRERRK